MARLPKRARRSGFTLIEVLAATVLTSIVIGVAVSLYINLSNAASAATARTREARNATVILDRVARDLEGAFLLDKPDDVDPLEHPWFFVAESRGLTDGADRMKFVTRNHRSLSTDGHTSEVGVVSYALYSEEDSPDEFALVRANSSRLPEGFDRTIPIVEDEGAILVADGIEAFGVRFLNANGMWVDERDSSQIEESSALPEAAEIRIVLASESASAAPDSLPETFSRRVILPIRPVSIDLAVEQASAIAAAATGEEGEGDEELGELAKQYEGEPPATNCEMTFLECFDIPKNRDRAQEALGTGDAFLRCRQNVANMPVCVEEYPAARLCGVPIECWYD